jgi:hypothetical protein
LINLPPIEHRASWLLNDDDENDTDYSADEDLTIHIQATKTKSGDKAVMETIPGSKGQEGTIPTGEHVGVG